MEKQGIRWGVLAIVLGAVFVGVCAFGVAVARDREPRIEYELAAFDCRCDPSDADVRAIGRQLDYLDPEFVESRNTIGHLTLCMQRVLRGLGVAQDSVSVLKAFAEPRLRGERYDQCMLSWMMLRTPDRMHDRLAGLYLREIQDATAVINARP